MLSIKKKVIARKEKGNLVTCLVLINEITRKE